MKLTSKLFTAAALWLLPFAALAQSSFPSAGGGGPRVPATVMMCLDATLNAVPCAASGSTGSAAVGNVASGATDSGNPVKTGAVVNTTAPAFSAGQRANSQADVNGNLYVIPTVNSAAASDGAANTMGFIADASATHAARSLGVYGFSFNGSTWDRDFSCTQTALVNVTAGSTTEIIPLTGSQTIRICSMVLSMSLTGTAAIQNGTGTNCATGTTAMTGAIPLLTSTPLAISAGRGSLLRAPVSNAVCVAAVTGNVVGFVTFAKF